MRGGLPFEVFLGLRYLRSRGQRTNLSLFVWIGVGGVFLGVAALIVVLAVMTGFQDGIREKIIAANPHLLVFQSGGSGLVNAADVAARVRGVRGVRSATPFVLQQALFTSAVGGAHGGLVRGVDLSTPVVARDLQSQLRSGTLAALEGAEPAILLGAELARTLGVVPGESVTVISPQGAVTAVGMVPRMRRYVVAGTFEIGMYEFDSSMAYLALPAAREFAGLGEGVTGIEVRLDDPFLAKSIARVVAQRLGLGFWIRDWMDMNRNLFAALQLEKLALFVIVTIIVLAGWPATCIRSITFP
jgi:lipoprotein-releasing system permease protein